MSWNDRDIIKQVVSAQGMSCEIAYYQQGNHIAKGGHSFCFQVRKFKGLTQQYLGEEAVLKIIDPKLKQKFLSVFENEVKVLRILNGQHCNRFSRYLTHWKCNKTQLCFILLEKCAFGSLLNFTQYVEQQGKTLTQLQIIFFLREILQAVQIMHNLKIIHRDLKLQNVLISSDLSVKLIDFGLSLVGQDQKQPLGTNMQGTPLYMSPQIVNGVDYSYEADIWAIGVILYYLMYFTFPFYGSSKAQVKDSVLSTDIKFQKKVEYKQLITICKSLLNRDKKMRPTVAQLLKQSIFQKLKKEADVQQRIYYKYQNYFNIKLRSYKWRERIIQEPIDLKVEVETMILNETQQQKRQRQSKFVQYVKRRSIKTQKVRIIHLIHNIKYGFFLLLSNLSLFAYFNNSKILRFYPSLLQRAQSNQQIILCCVYKKHFKEMMDKQYQEDLDVQFNEPNCSIAKVSLVNDNFFVRLTNNVLQVYLTKAAKAEDGSFIFTLQLQYNTNTVNYKQITVLSRDGKVNTYSDYQQASKSFHGKYVNYVKDIFEIILDNSCISFQQLQLKRKS